MNKTIYITLLLALFVSCNVKKQDCSKLLNEEIRFPKQNEYFETYLNEFLNKYQQVFLCEFDTIDYLIMIGPEKNLPQITYASMYIEKDKRKTYYREFVDMYKAFKQTDEYTEIRSKIEKIYEFSKQEISQMKRASVEELLAELGFSEEQISEMKAQKETKTTQIKQEIEINSEMKYLVEGLPVYTDYEKGINKAKELNRKIIIYFTGKTCANSMQMEKTVLTDKQVCDLINENYVMICLYADDRTELAEEEIYYSDVLGKKVERKGQVYLEMQKRDYDMVSQPFFVILNTKGKEITREIYVGDVEKFKEFLKKE